MSAGDAQDWYYAGVHCCEKRNVLADVDTHAVHVVHTLLPSSALKWTAVVEFDYNCALHKGFA